MRNKFDEKIINEKLRHYCAYQERCLQEVIKKLKSFGSDEGMIERIVEDLIRGNFINEKRYAELFARGKFRNNKWGKQKISAELRKRNIPKEFIISGLAEIDDDDYLLSLKSLIQKKIESLDKNDGVKLKQKLVSYAINKGYEAELVWNVVKNLK